MNRIDKPISFSEFYENYLKLNKPCIISQACSQSKDWHSTQTWIADNSLNVDYLRKFYGDLKAPVMDCGKQYFSSHEKHEMKVSEFFDYWENRDDRLLYLKDWHLQRVTDSVFYSVPIYFSSDWLNEYFDHLNTDDYRFVYIGVKGSWTPFHADVFRSHSWSANICGLKKWIFYPPGKEQQLKDKYGNLPFNVADATGFHESDPIVVFQKTGEIIFVPSGWYHQVFNLEDTVSINHNWVNACCIQNMLEHLKSELLLVKHEINDCIDMDGFAQQCQLILAASSGMDFIGLFDMVYFLALKRTKIAAVVNSSRINDSSSDDKTLDTLFISSKPSIFIDIFKISVNEKCKLLHNDLKSLHSVLDALLTNSDFKAIADNDIIGKGEKVKTDIEKCII